ncbi:flagella basal body P-ring formation protein FlgA [uncultured Sphingomonas sp.]|uniref:flagella basal body P-ring formation protein FlgA n=1 Tax=uncultured Sphingomonas sp. TaxID=158754 RepID=UPI0035C9E741
MTQFLPRRRAAFGIAALMVAMPVAAQNFQNTLLLDKAVAGFTGHAVGDEGGARSAVDARLRLAACPMVSLSWYTDRHDAVVVACPDPVWRIFVAVRVTAPAASPRAMATPVAKPDIVIRRGDPLTIVADADGFSVTRDGIALGDAAIGGRLPVEVEKGRPPVQAIATGPGQAKLPGAP